LQLSFAFAFKTLKCALQYHLLSTIPSLYVFFFSGLFSFAACAACESLILYHTGAALVPCTVVMVVSFQLLMA